MANLLEKLLSIEHAGWRSLCDGTASNFYSNLMTTDGQMIFTNGMSATRADVVAMLKDAPPWDGYEIRDAELIDLGARAAALVYTGVGRRDVGDDFIAKMTSVYKRAEQGWQLALYTQAKMTV